jgi:hypothetical protein
MSDKPYTLWERLLFWCRHHLAYLAMRVLGPAALYWCNPTEWDAYLSEGNDAVRVPENIRDTLFSVLCAGDYRALNEIEGLSEAYDWLDAHTYAQPESEAAE